MSLEEKKILLGVTGGIAAYKSAELCRLFVKAGASVQAVMTRAACEFITPLTMSTLSGRPVHVEMFENRAGNVPHIEDGEKADILVIAPCTADFLGRAATGRAEDLLSAITLAFDGPVLVAPAMNTNMWKNPAVQRNLSLLVNEHGWRTAAPGTGELACGWTGPGRMAEPSEILAATCACFCNDLKEKHILVTAGPTVEDIDPVRFISNRSSGKMGYAIAAEAASRGAEVTLVSGPTALPCPQNVRRISVRSAVDMEKAVAQVAESCDAIVMAAAVSDFRPTEKSDRKMKKSKGETERTLRLVSNPDILQGLGERFKHRDRPYLAGFAVETENLLDAAKAKLEKKGADMIVANLAADGFEGDDNKISVVEHNAKCELGPLPKRDLARSLLDIIAARISSKTTNF
jgi:phosphopantothenoylcysteine decarboxylase / phosphopantothenate---cysteine ligase